MATNTQSLPPKEDEKHSTSVSVKSKHGSFSRFHFFASTAVLAMGVLVGQSSMTENGLNLKAHIPRQLMQVFAPTQEETEGLVSKYSTDIVDTKPRVLLPRSDLCMDTAYEPKVIVNPESPYTAISIVDVMAAPTLGQDQVFFMLNGRNEGIHVSWNGQYECLLPAAELAAKWLGADADEIVNGVRLYSQMGHPVRSLKDLEATRNLVHILLDFQLWQWPGIKKGHQYVLENGVTLTTVGLSPKVLDVQYFLTEVEANSIIERGLPSLNRSKVDSANSSEEVSSARTSHTAFLQDDEFTRDFRRRSTFVARLPSPSYAERLHLVRYAAGEFYRQHLDTFDSREIVPKQAYQHTMEDYEAWATWAADTLRSLGNDERIPLEFREGGDLFPNATDTHRFPLAFLKLAYEDMMLKNSFAADFEESWAEWMKTNIDGNKLTMMPGIMKAEGGKPHYLARAVRTWEQKLGLRELFYTFPKKPMNGVTQYLRWIRWAKERVTFLGDQVPAIARRDGAYFPTYTAYFQYLLVQLILKDYSANLLSHLMNDDWHAWMVENHDKNNVLVKAMEKFPTIAEIAVRSWERHVGSSLLHYTFPTYVRHFHPQRYVTLFMYLNNETKIGGETVFPFSLDRYSDETIERRGMDECSKGLAVPPRGLHASLFYVQTPEGDIDPMSRHGGCPPHEGIKWGSNSFMWNADADEGADLWSTK